ncbi:hypothetical protein [Nannocystis sp.]|uniref:hypothetical protein n=1 Tax=Nannocystis sp. TaxID=1962667 RepID=UPI0025E42988|nr:hypothetical protein [Nannocystis sp.]MBK7829391.1 hypothetical protein [Nannocystis sp.]
MALDRGGPAYAWLVSGALLLMVLSPLCRPPGADSFPWSSYPMFGRGLASAHTTVHHMIAFDAAGGRRVVPPALVANDEVLQAEATLHGAARGGKQTSLELCRQVAARLADDPAWADIVRVELRSERYDAITYFEGDTAPIRPGRLRARCTPPGVVEPADAQQQPKKKKKKKKRRTRKPPAPNLSPGTPTNNLSPGTPTNNLSPGTSPAARSP